MHINLTISNFFQSYAIDPLSKDLSPRDQKIALISTIALGILSFGLVQAGVALYNYLTSKVEVIKSDTNSQWPAPDPESEKMEKLFEVAIHLYYEGRYQESRDKLLECAQGKSLTYAHHAFRHLENKRAIYEAYDESKELYTVTLPRLKEAFEPKMKVHQEALDVERMKRIQKWEVQPPQSESERQQAALDYKKEGLWEKAMAVAIKGATDKKSEHYWTKWFVEFLKQHEEKFKEFKEAEGFYKNQLPKLEAGYKKAEAAEHAQNVKKWDKISEIPSDKLHAAIFDYTNAQEYQKAFNLIKRALKDTDDMNMNLSTAVLYLNLHHQEFSSLPGGKEVYETVLPQANERLEARRSALRAEMINEFEKASQPEDLKRGLHHSPPSLAVLPIEPVEEPQNTMDQWKLCDLAREYDSQGHLQNAFYYYFLAARDFLNGHSLDWLRTNQARCQNLEGGKDVYELLPQLVTDREKRLHRERVARIAEWEANPSEDRDTIYLAASLYHDHGLFQKALALFIKGAKAGSTGCLQALQIEEKTYRDLPEASKIYEELPTLIEQSKNKERASYEKIISDWEANPSWDSPQEIYTVGCYYHLLGKFDKAFECFYRSLELGYEFSLVDLKIHRKEYIAHHVEAAEIYRELDLIIEEYTERQERQKIEELEAFEQHHRLAKWDK